MTCALSAYGELCVLGNWSACPAGPAIESMEAPEAGKPAGSSPAPQARGRRGRLEAGGLAAQPWRAPSIIRLTAAALLLMAPACPPAGAQALPALSPTTAPDAVSVAAVVASAAQRFGLPQTWIWAVMRAESALNPRATSPKGAMGLMQLMPATYADLRAQLGLGEDPYDAHDNVLAGAAYLRALYDQFGPAGFLAAYNVGPGRYLDFLSRGRPLPEETRRYVAAVAAGVAGAAPPLPVRLRPTPPPSLFAPVAGVADVGADLAVSQLASREALRSSQPSRGDLFVSAAERGQP